MKVQARFLAYCIVVREHTLILKKFNILKASTFLVFVGVKHALRKDMPLQLLGGCALCVPVYICCCAGVISVHLIITLVY